MRLSVRNVLSFFMSVVIVASCLSARAFASVQPEVIMTSVLDASERTVTLDVSVKNIKGISSAAVFIGYSSDEVTFVGATDAQTGLSCADRVYTDDCVISAAFMSSSVFDSDEYDLGSYVFKINDSAGEVTFTVLGEKPYLSRAFDENDSPVIIKTTEYKAFSGCFHEETQVTPGYAATCTQSGLTDLVKCLKCGETLSEQTEIPPLGHDVKDGVCVRCNEKIDLSYPTLKDGANYIIDYDKKTVVIMPDRHGTVSVYEFKSKFNEELKFPEDAVSVKTGLKFTCSAEYTIILKGDVIADGQITASDSRAILRIAARLDNADEISRSAADLNSDGNVSASEARSALRFSARLTSSII